MDRKITDKIFYAGVKDTTLDLFESQYQVPDGVTYNSYVILDEQIAIMDTVDPRATEEWMDNLKEILEGKAPDYLIISHVEPDHGGSIQRLADACPQMKLVGNIKTFQMLNQFFALDLENRKVVVKEGDTLSLGSHTLHFSMAPMVHWPEVMVTYEDKEKILFSADGFGTFGTSMDEKDWINDARRYYMNIVGKYGAPVQALLKKAAALDIACICPLHGPILKENLGYFLEKYDIWSSYRPEEEGVVIACASIHGHTKKAAEKLEELLKDKGETSVICIDLTRDDLSKAVETAFRYDQLVLATATYDGGIFPPMEDFLHHLKAKTFQNRRIALMENGSWAPMAAKGMKGILEGMKNLTFCETTVTIKSAMNEETVQQLDKLADELVKRA
ncbi:MAG: FprA family A-type flavoprotein [Lachnospiraceae bacterium]|nr:FprA family A-type flavoprotein [Lachnospiraceae bacterium]